MSVELALFPGARLRPARGLRVVYGLTAMLIALIGGVAAFVPELRAMMLGWAVLTSVSLALGMRQLRRNSPPGGGEVEVRDDGVYVEGRLALPRTAIERAVVVHDARGASVSIHAEQGFASLIDVTSREQGEALVRALGLSADQAVATFPLDSPVAARLPAWAFYLYLATFPVLVIWPVARHAAWIAATLGPLWFAGTLSALLPSAITVGTDGILVRWLWRRELIRFADLRGVEHDGEHLHLHLTDGSRRTLGARWEGSRFASRHGAAAGFASQEAYLDAIVARVREALASRGQAGRAGGGAGGAPGSSRGRLDHRAARRAGARGGRVPRGRDLRRRPVAHAGGRRRRPRGPRRRRVALGPTLGEDDRARLRAAARVVVAPRLRVALEAVADGDEAGAEEALAEIESCRPYPRCVACALIRSPTRPRLVRRACRRRPRSPSARC